MLPAAALGATAAHAGTAPDEVAHGAPPHHSRKRKKHASHKHKKGSHAAKSPPRSAPSAS